MMMDLFDIDHVFITILDYPLSYLEFFGLPSTTADVLRTVARLDDGRADLPGAQTP